jgi:hypothetical protein
MCWSSGDLPAQDAAFARVDDVKISRAIKRHALRLGKADSPGAGSAAVSYETAGLAEYPIGNRGVVSGRRRSTNLIYKFKIGGTAESI